jgi:hypothetical protein
MKANDLTRPEPLLFSLAILATLAQALTSLI